MCKHTVERQANTKERRRDLFLLVDEIPSNSNRDLAETPSGDWTGLQPDGVNLMMALQPFKSRVYRTSASLSRLFDTLAKSLTPQP